MGYGAALRQTLRTTAAAYGYALSLTSTAAALNSILGKPAIGQLFVFVAGALAAFAALEALMLAEQPGDDDAGAGQAFPFAGALNCFSVPAALGSSIGVAHAVSGTLAWLLAPFAATAVYLLIVAVQVRVVEAVRA